jgi:lysophospholipid acyltransferase (LPLAT)-like uncharacterized protein
MSPGRKKPSVGDRILVGFVGCMGPPLVRLLGWTWRSSEIHIEHVERVHESGRPALLAFWHGTLLPLEYTCRGRNIQALSSLHRDGEMIARLMVAMGYGVVRGSSNRGSARGLLRMLARAVEGLDLTIAPDGPKGPARRVKRGIFYLAEKSGGKVIPVGAAAARAKRLSSWDSFMIPLPFTRVAVVYGEPLEWDESAPFEEKAALLEAALDRVNTEATEAVAR